MFSLRGHSKKLSGKGYKRDIGKFCFTSRVCNVWNSLTEEVVSAKDVRAFEIGLDAHWSNQDLMYDDFKAEIIV